METLYTYILADRPNIGSRFLVQVSTPKPCKATRTLCKIHSSRQRFDLFQ
jgi:hypothetical protein